MNQIIIEYLADNFHFNGIYLRLIDNILKIKALESDELQAIIFLETVLEDVYPQELQTVLKNNHYTYK
ncbi:hypothetical protein SAMN05421767_10427 [Granulicatella balaenopterae]|uniref:Uncharacterized protein n=1 Tax=Granulicatella balaenopterae TaxID=137733 RepID=A0A1H9I1F2_9LACT|nr:hypothetical protein [Granulicatella balaenopterae]SEQ68451.1 hypothetical protein SAMN05421767_10427 [Granulicatella balaenopterae]